MREREINIAHFAIESGEYKIILANGKAIDLKQLIPEIVSELGNSFRPEISRLFSREVLLFGQDEEGEFIEYDDFGGLALDTENYFERETDHETWLWLWSYDERVRYKKVADVPYWEYK